MSEEVDPLERLLWIELPEDGDRDIGGFALDPAIPLPIEEENNGEKGVDPESLTWEKVIAAVLLVLANRPSHRHADYYRNLLGVIRPSLATELMEAAESRAKERDWKSAEEVLLALRGLEPDETAHRLALAVLYDDRSSHESKSGDPATARNYSEAADAAYNELVSADAPSSRAWFRAGTFRFRQGRYSPAADALEAFLDAGTDDEDTREAERLLRLCRVEGLADDVYQRAYADLVAGAVEDGLENANRFLADHPEGWPGWFLLGWGYRLSGRWEEGREALIKARDRGCREPDLWNELAICSMECGDGRGAEEALMKALEIDPENIKILSNMAMVKRRLGDVVEARRWLETATTLEPGDPIARRLLEEIDSYESSQ